MESLKKILGIAPARSLPARIESDENYPVHILDGTKTMQSIIITWMLRFNDVLDPDALHTSLSKLLEIGDWKKLGGRLRLKENGQLEIHVPQPFTAERPAIFYSHEIIAMDISDHPLASNLPKATESPTIQSGPQSFQPFAVRPDAPATFEDFLYQDIPLLSLHITSFNDATLVGLSWPHSLFDVMGQQALLNAWSLVLAGKESEVPPFLGAREDVLILALDAATEKEEFKLEPQRLKGFGMLIFGLRFAWDILTNRVVETRTIFLPKKVVAGLRRQAQCDLVSGVAEDIEKAPFLSVGDVLTAWATRMVASALPNPRPVTILHALNAKFRLPLLAETQGVNVHNLVAACFTFLSHEVAAGPLGPTALENRRQLMEQATEGQVLAMLREVKKESETSDDPRVLCGPSDALLLPFTNWDRADIFKTADFGPAVKRTGEVGVERNNPPGTMVFHHAHSMAPGIGVRNVVVVLGKDHGDNYWVMGTLLPAAWAKIEENIREMSS